MIEINKDPSPRDLAWFGALFAIFLSLVGMVVWWRTGNRQLAGIFVLVGVGLAIAYYAIPPLRRPMFVGWMYLAFPIGWTISMVILVAAFALVLTPTGWLMRLFGADPLHRKLDPKAESYWIDRGPAPEPGRYFRQW